MADEVLEVGYISILFVEIKTHVSQAVLTLALQVHLELRSSCFHFTRAKISIGAPKTSEDSTSHRTQDVLHARQSLCQLRCVYSCCLDFPTVLSFPAEAL